MKQTATAGATVQRWASSRRIAVVPVYNEEATVVSVLQRLEPLVDEIVVINDGSSDRSGELILAWSESRPHVHSLFFPRNRGMSAAYYAAFRHLGERAAAGEISPDDVVITVDADGQHEPADLDALFAHLVDGRYDAVMARRDLSAYPLMKRFGNAVISLWASLWAGRRLYDVESGFRVFRLGPLLEALNYYKGYRYSETVEVAVVLPRLGYRVTNDHLVPVPRIRSRTRIKDGVIDVLAIVAAWWRVFAGRNRPHGMPAWSIYVVPSLGLLGLVFIAMDLLVNPLFLASDSMHSYAHVWYISQELFHHATFPLRVALLDSGRAAAFPYAFAPYLLGAIIWPLLGDWVVTLLMAVAVVGSVWAAGRVRPTMWDPWFVLLFVMNPFFIDAIYSFQFATLWSVFFFFLFAWAFERGRYLLAAPLLWLAVSSHPILGSAAAGAYGLCLLVFDQPKVRPLLLVAVPVGLALIPIYWMMALTPSATENSFMTVFTSAVGSLANRGTIYMAPFVLSALAPYIRRLYRPALAFYAGLTVTGVVLLAGFVHFQGAPGGYYGATHRSSDIYAAFFRSPSFQPGATYRVLEPSNREDGMYRFMRHGAVLSNEFFNESVFRRGWTEPQYGCYAAFKGIDYVVVESAYLARWHVNEGALLQTLVGESEAAVAYTDPAGRFTVYDIRKFTSEQSKPHSLKECGVF